MFIPYLGEKSKFENFIVPNIPKDISVYSEPFSGMFGIFFCLDLNEYPDTKFIYNDINKLNYNLFNQIKNQRFIEELESFIATEEIYYKVQSQLYNNSWTDIESAINWLVVLCCSESQYDISNGVYKNDGEFEIFKLKLRHQDKIDRISEIYNIDYKEIVNKFDSESSFFYIDPPYKNREHYYINHNFNTNSHKELSSVIKTIKGRFALSYYDFPELEKWYRDYRIVKNKTFMGTEFLIMNY